MLFLHIGSQKTGSTAIQVMLSKSAEAMESSGYILPKFGNKHHGHNRLAQELIRRSSDDLIDGLYATVRDNPDKTVVISSEMLFRPQILHRLFDTMPADIAAQTKVLCYLRRQDQYIESVFKQKLKNRRCGTDPWAYWHTNKAEADYASMLDIVASAIGRENVIARVFDRSLLTDGDVVADFLAMLDTQGNWDVPKVDETVNPTFSKEFSMVLNHISGATSLNTREIIRAVVAMRLKDVIRSGDVFRMAQKREIIEEMSGSNERLLKGYFPDQKQVFDCSDLSATDVSDTEWSARQLTDRDAAEIAVFTAIEKVRNAK